MIGYRIIKIILGVALLLLSILLSLGTVITAFKTLAAMNKNSSEILRII